MTKIYRLIFIEYAFNLLGFVGITLILLASVVCQILLHELPCPLCLLQRLGFLGIALGFLMNVSYGPRPSQYAIVLLSACYAGLVGARQVLLHIVPGTGSYGNAVLGLHLYTWTCISSVFVIIVTSIMLGFSKQSAKSNYNVLHFSTCSHLLFGTMLAVAVANVMLVVFQCGLYVCPDNPTTYLFHF